ncbi:hypothetical protein [Aquimarina pacifica]|uniref:hypothetical protein n=1 Tax=Aquimarina pacifica TaxID=1296415 RepID=UPI0004B2A496|nr:hypothetical protein [Aquimarina pacifica]
MILLLTGMFLFSCSSDDKKSFPGGDDDIIEEDDDGGAGILSNEKEIITFNFRSSDNPDLSQDVIGILYNDGSIKASVPYGSELNQLTPTITLSENATVSPDSQET